MTTTNPQITIQMSSDGWISRWTDEHGTHKLPIDAAGNATDAQVIGAALPLFVEGTPMNDTDIAALRDSITVVR